MCVDVPCQCASVRESCALRCCLCPSILPASSDADIFEGVGLLGSDKHHYATLLAGSNASRTIGRKPALVWWLQSLICESFA